MSLKAQVVSMTQEGTTEQTARSIKEKVQRPWQECMTPNVWPWQGSHVRSWRLAREHLTAPDLVVLPFLVSSNTEHNFRYAHEAGVNNGLNESSLV